MKAVSVSEAVTAKGCEVNDELWPLNITWQSCGSDFGECDEVCTVPNWVPFRVPGSPGPLGDLFADLGPL